MTARQLLDQAMTEQQWQQTVTDLARTLGWRCLHIHDTRREVTDRAGSCRLVGDAAAAGLPDLILIRDRVVWAELKTQRGRLRPAQVEVIGALLRAGAEVYVWRPQDYEQAVEVLTRGRP